MRVCLATNFAAKRPAVRKDAQRHQCLVEPIAAQAHAAQGKPRAGHAEAQNTAKPPPSSRQHRACRKPAACSSDSKDSTRYL